MSDLMVEITRVERIKCPQIPNFLFTESGKQVSISELHDAEIEALGRVWAEAIKNKKKSFATNAKQGNKE